MNDTERTVKLDVREIAARPSSKRPVLVVLQGQSIGQTIQLDKEQTIIGRGSQVDLVLRDEIASRQHAEITRLNAEGDIAEYYVSDLGSTNGTFLNGTKVTSQQLLEDGDDLSLANVVTGAGFSDQSQFSHHFKRVVGVTPGEFRRSRKGRTTTNVDMED